MQDFAKNTLTSKRNQFRSKIYFFFSSISLIVGNMVGIGIYFLPSALAPLGISSIIGFLISSIGCICLSFTLSRFVIYSGNKQNLHTYSNNILGKKFNFLVSWGYWIMSWTGSTATVIAILSYLAIFFPSIKNNNIISFIIGFLLIWVMTIINFLQINIGNSIRIFLTMSKIVPLLILIFLFIKKTLILTPVNFISIKSYDFIDILDFKKINESSILSLWSFIGLESSIFSLRGLSKEDNKIISYTTVISTILVAFLNLLIILFLFTLLPLKQISESASPFNDIIRTVFGAEKSSLLFSIIIIISGIGSLNGWIFIHGQIPTSFIKEIPKFNLNEKNNNLSKFNLVLGSILMTILLISNYHKKLIDQFILMLTLGSYMMLFFYLAYSLMSVKFFYYKVNFISRLIFVLTILYILWMIFSIGFLNLIFCVCGYGIGMLIYLFLSKLRYLD